MNLIKINTDQTVVYPYSINQLKEDYPNTSFPSQIDLTVLNDYSVYEVVEIPHTINPYKLYTEDVPIYSNGRWNQVWIETDMTQTEIDNVKLAEWETIRYKRNQYLSECDWTQLPDSPLSEQKKSEWSIYRQELRDITSQLDPFNIVWPTKPENN